MEALPFLLAIGWLLQSNLVSAQIPLLASSQICQINPTTTTITLEKPYCFYVSTTAAQVYLYVVQDGVLNLNLLPNNTYSSTNKGTSAPYVADIFDNPNCTGIPTKADIYDATKAQTILGQYVVRVGSEEVCTGPSLCNGRLEEKTAYRFRYAFYDKNTPPSLLSSSSWSPPIYTRRAKSSNIIDTWPGGRSGGMIVITSIISILMFFVLAGLVAAIITNIMSPTTSLPSTVHESQSSHPGPQKSDPNVGYETALGAQERYATSP